MRVPDWESRLAATIAFAENQEAKWGVHDCVTFANRCVNAILGGYSPWNSVMSGWTSERQALRQIISCGGLLQAIDAKAVRVDWKNAKRGDIAAVLVDETGKLSDSGTQISIGVVEYSRILIAAKPRGLAKFPIGSGQVFWSVG